MGPLCAKGKQENTDSLLSEVKYAVVGDTGRTQWGLILNSKVYSQTSWGTQTEVLLIVEED